MNIISSVDLSHQRVYLTVIYIDLLYLECFVLPINIHL